MKKALSILVLLGAISVSAANDHWVGTWATAVVIRPQPLPPSAAFSQATAPAQAPPISSGVANACAPAAFGPPPGGGRGGPGGPAPGGGGRAGGAPPAPLNFKNQTLREIVHVSLG